MDTDFIYLLCLGLCLCYGDEEENGQQPPAGGQHGVSIYSWWSQMEWEEVEEIPPNHQTANASSLPPSAASASLSSLSPSTLSTDALRKVHHTKSLPRVTLRMITRVNMSMKPAALSDTWNPTLRRLKQKTVNLRST